jgi:hypothetical protein
VVVDDVDGDDNDDNDDDKDATKMKMKDVLDQDGSWTFIMIVIAHWNTLSETIYCFITTRYLFYVFLPHHFEF